jgi:polygalacturonase
MESYRNPAYLFNINDYGAICDGQSNNAPAIQAAIEACQAAGGGTVFIPAGVYVTGPLFLHSEITLYLDAGARLQASENLQDYPVVAGRWEGIDQQTYAPLIGGSQLHHVTISGRGTIDGQGEMWWSLHKAKQLAYPRPRLIGLMDCSNVLIEGITAVNSPAWTINPVRCDNVTIDKVTIINPPNSPNTDGINPDSCRNVHISNCAISAGDDCITIKSGKETAGRDNLLPCENITVTNCTMAHGHGGVVIGSEMSGSVRQVVISNCVFLGTDRGLRLKSRRGRGGIVEDIRVSNIVMDGVMCPLTMNLYYAPGAWGNKENADKQPKAVYESTPIFRHIHLANITARRAGSAAAFLFGLAEMPLEDITLSHVSIAMDPVAKPDYPDMADDLELMQRAGLYIRNVRGLTLDHVEVSGQQGPAFTLIDAGEVDLQSCGTNTPDGEAPVILLKACTNVFVHGCRASAGTGVFVDLQGTESGDVLMEGNDTRNATQDIINASGQKGSYPGNAGRVTP